MRTLSSTLLASQKEVIGTPAVGVAVRPRLSAAIKLKWTPIYQGLDAPSYHAAAAPDDGSLGTFWKSVKVAKSIPGSDCVTGYYCAVASFNEQDHVRRIHSPADKGRYSPESRVTASTRPAGISAAASPEVRYQPASCMVSVWYNVVGKRD